MVKTYGELAKVSLFQGKSHDAYENINKGLENLLHLGPSCLVMNQGQEMVRLRPEVRIGENTS